MDCRAGSETGLYTTPFPEEAFPREWLNCAVPVVFDFENAPGLTEETAHLARPLWCLLPRCPFGRAVVLQISRESFVRWTHDKANPIPVQAILQRVAVEQQRLAQVASLHATQMAMAQQIPMPSMVERYEAAAADNANNILSPVQNAAQKVDVACDILHIKDQTPAEGIIAAATAKGFDRHGFAWAPRHLPGAARQPGPKSRDAKPYSRADLSMKLPLQSSYRLTIARSRTRPAPRLIESALTGGPIPVNRAAGGQLDGQTAWSLPAPGPCQLRTA
jgi:hypothetical protein